MTSSSPRSPCSTKATTMIPSTTENDRLIYDRDDIRRIYQKKNIVFFGDGTMRSMYCDLARYLQNGKMLKNTETKYHCNRHDPYVNETIIQSFTKCPMPDKIDFRRYVCKPSSTVLYLIFFGSVLRPKCPISIEWLRQITQGSPIDLVIMSCAYPDLSDRQLEKDNEQFDNKFELFKSKFSTICSIFKLAFFESINIWVPPLPSTSLNDKQIKNLQQLIETCFDIACEKNHFQLLKNHQNWIKYYEKLFVKDQFYISNEGARELTIEMTELIKSKWDSELQIESPNKRFKMDPVVSK